MTKIYVTEKFAPTQLSYAGRQEAGFEHEKNDCTVRALSFFRNIDYKTAHSMMKCIGMRKDGRGAYFPHYRTLFEASGAWIPVAGSTGPKTVGSFLKKFPKGKYAVIIKGHMFTVIDGVVHDSGLNKLTARVKVYCSAFTNEENKVEKKQEKKVHVQHKIKIDGVFYNSVADAFRQLELPMSRHQLFRKNLKAAGKLEFDGILFEIVEVK